MDLPAAAPNDAVPLSVGSWQYLFPRLAQPTIVWFPVDLFIDRRELVKRQRKEESEREHTRKGLRRNRVDIEEICPLAKAPGCKQTLPALFIDDFFPLAKLNAGKLPSF